MRAETANRWFPGAGVQELTAEGHEGTVGGDVVSSCKRDVNCAGVDEEESVSTPNVKKVKMDDLVHEDWYY